MKNKVLIFDLDATLYYVGNKIEKLCDRKVISYIVKNLHLSEDKADSLVKSLREKYRYDSEAISYNYSLPQREFVEYICDVSTDDIYQDKELDAILNYSYLKMLEEIKNEA